MRLAVAQRKMTQPGTWQRKELVQMSAYEFRQWVELLEKRTGINLPERRKSFLQTSVTIRMRELGYEDYNKYFRYILSGRRGAVEWEILVDRLTVHETRFFRDETALELIQKQYLEHLHMKDMPHRFNVWSVGCATGEEPYSLAIMIDHYLKHKDIDFYLAVTASDISSAALATGRRGVYQLNRLKNLGEGYINRYFEQISKQHYQVVPSIRDRVCFTRLNLLDLSQTKHSMMDLIVCQNVLIYFKRHQRLKILGQLVKYLRPGGILVLGVAEISDWGYPGMERIGYPGTLAFRRTTSSRGDA